MPVPVRAFAPGQSPSITEERGAEALQEIADLLLKHGADPVLQRRSVIAVSRKAANFSAEVFRKDMSGHNRYTLLELIGWGFLNGDRPLRFPDLANISISRLTGTNGTKEIKVNLELRLKGGDCGQVPWLEWGDVVEFPEKNHLLEQSWPGFEPDIASVMHKCVERNVQIIVNRRTNYFTLHSGFPATPNVPPSPAGVRSVPPSLPAPGRPVLHPLRTSDNPQHMNYCPLQGVVTESGLLRTSSDVSRVIVKRKDAATGKVLEWSFDPTKPLGNYDLWLRDGDVVVIPEKRLTHRRGGKDSSDPSLVASDPAGDSVLGAAVHRGTIFAQPRYSQLVDGAGIPEEFPHRAAPTFALHPCFYDTRGTDTCG